VVLGLSRPVRKSGRQDSQQGAGKTIDPLPGGQNPETSRLPHHRLPEIGPLGLVVEDPPSWWRRLACQPPCAHPRGRSQSLQK
jgi:hypothetical protein